MKPIQEWFDAYGESHQNKTNKLIHWVCVPAIMFSIFGLLMSIPFFTEVSIFLNWASVVFVFVLVFYLRLSFTLFVGFIAVGTTFLGVNYCWFSQLEFSSGLFALWSTIIFATAWIFQFVGHKIEGAKPSFLEDLQFLLIGPAWLMHFIYKKLGIPY